MNLSKTKRNDQPTESVDQFASRHGLDPASCRLAANRGAIVARQDGKLRLAGGTDPATLRRSAGGQDRPRQHDSREYRAGDVPSAMPTDSRTEAQRTSLQARREPERRQAHRAAVEQARAAQRPQPAPKTSAPAGAYDARADRRTSLAERARARRQGRAA